MRIFALIVVIVGAILSGAIFIGSATIFFAFGSATIFFAFGFVILYSIGWRDYQIAKKSVNWPRVIGTILNSKVVKERSGGRRGRGHTYSYYPDISYSYIVDKKQFQSSQIHVGGKLGTSSKYAHQYIKKYPVGKGVVVYYSTQDESNAVLEPGVHRLHYIPLAFGILFISLGVFVFFLRFLNEEGATFRTHLFIVLILSDCTIHLTKKQP